MTDDVMRKMDQITDFSYSWETIDEYIVYLHRIIEQVRTLLRAIDNAIPTPTPTPPLHGCRLNSLVPITCLDSAATEPQVGGASARHLQEIDLHPGRPSAAHRHGTSEPCEHAYCCLTSLICLCLSICRFVPPHSDTRCGLLDLLLKPLSSYLVNVLWIHYTMVVL